MERVISRIVVKKKRESAHVLGYSKTDRGQRFVKGFVEIDMENLSQVEVNKKIIEAITKLLEPQVKAT